MVRRRFLLIRCRILVLTRRVAFLEYASLVLLLRQWPCRRLSVITLNPLDTLHRAITVCVTSAVPLTLPSVLAATLLKTSLLVVWLLYSMVTPPPVLRCAARKRLLLLIRTAKLSVLSAWGMTATPEMGVEFPRVVVMTVRLALRQEMILPLRLDRIADPPPLLVTMMLMDLMRLLRSMCP